MTQKGSRISHIPAALLLAALVNAVLFAGLPMLTKVQQRERTKPFDSPIMLMAHKPPKPPEPEEKKRKLEVDKLKKMPKKQSMKRRSANRPDIDVPRFEFAQSAGGIGVGVGMVSGAGMKDLDMIKSKIGFEIGEVDTPPRILRKFNPVYPFGAKRQGITGHVLVRCLIRVDGTAEKLSILESKPEGVFDEAALSAIGKWRFKPGILGGDPVPTWVRIPLTFELD